MGVLEIKASDGILYIMADRTLAAYTAPKVQENLSSIYYTPEGYWRGLTAIKKLATAAKVSEQVALNWLKRQAIWQIYLPAPRLIPRPMFDEDSPNAVYQADLLYLRHDRVDRRTYKFALTVVDVASRCKEAESLIKVQPRLPLCLVASTSAGLSLGLDFCRLTRDVSSWAHSPSCWRNIMYRCGAARRCRQPPPARGRGTV